MKTRITILCLIIFVNTALLAKSITINSGTTVSGGSSIITIGGNWSNAGTFTVGTSTVILNGASTQYIGHTFYNLTVDKPGAGAVVMTNSLSIAGTLTLTSGTINVNWSNITMGSSATLVETAGNVVLGSGGRIYATRDLNAPSSENVAGLGAIITSSANLGVTTIQRGHDAQTGGGNTGIKRYFDIAPTNNSSLDATLAFSYDESELNSIAESRLNPFRSEDSGATWSLIDGSSADVGANTVTFSGLATLSRFTLASEDAPLSPPVRVQVKVFLEGPYDDASNEMSTIINGSIPTTSPYTDARVVNPIPSVDIVDWIYVELRTTTDGSAVVSRSAFLHKDGRIVDDDGTTEYIQLSAATGDYFIIIKHRNHLAVMSDEVHTLAEGSSTLYDFTVDGEIGEDYDKYYGSEGAAVLEGTGENKIYGMFAGDVNQNGEITTEDYTAWYNDARVGASGYQTCDINLDGEVTTEDYTLWYNNARIGASSNVPNP